MANNNNLLAQIMAAMNSAASKPDNRTQLNSGATYADLLGQISGKFGSGDDIISYLNGLGVFDFKGLDMSQRQDWNKQLLDTLLQQLLTNENRQYNESMRDEQRQYDSPLSQLSRLTGAGIGRDAAIQMLSGVQQPIQSDATAASPGVPASQSTLNGVQSVVAPIQTLIGAASTIGSLVSLGVSLPSAIAQNKINQSQAVMSEEMSSGLTAANQVMQSFSNLVADGTLSIADLEAMPNASDALKYAEEHRETNGFKALFEPNGAMSKVLGTKSGNEFFDSLWKSQLSNRHAGDMLDQQFRIQALNESLMELDTIGKRRQYFMDFINSFQQFLNENADYNQKLQDYRAGKIQILINGEILKQESLKTKTAERNSYIEGTQFDAYKNFIENGAPEEPSIKSSGQAILNYNTWTEWYKQMCKDVAAASTKPSSLDNHGFNNAQRTRWTENKYNDILYTGLLLREAQEEGRLDGWTGNSAPIYQFFDMFTNSGGDKVAAAGTSAAGAAGALIRMIPK